MTITTSEAIEGKRIIRYLGIVAGEAVIGSNLFADLFRGIRGIVGGRASQFEKDLAVARNLALKDMEANAAQMGANAVIGVDLDYEALGVGETILMVIANGTAVEIE